MGGGWRVRRGRRAGVRRGSRGMDPQPVARNRRPGRIEPSRVGRRLDARLAGIGAGAGRRRGTPSVVAPRESASAGVRGADSVRPSFPGGSRNGFPPGRRGRRCLAARRAPVDLSPRERLARALSPPGRLPRAGLRAGAGLVLGTADGSRPRSLRDRFGGDGPERRVASGPHPRALQLLPAGRRETRIPPQDLGQALVQLRFTARGGPSPSG